MKPKYIILIIVAVCISLFYIYIWKSGGEVLDAFETMNEQLMEQNNVQPNARDSLRWKLENTGYKQKAQGLNAKVSTFKSYVQELKEELLTKVDDPTDYEKMDSSTPSDQFFFNDNGYTEKGQEFVDTVNNLKTDVIQYLGSDFPDIEDRLESVFNQRDDIDDWLDYNFKGFPFIAVVTKLTNIQAQIDHLEEELYTDMLDKAMILEE